MIDLSPTARILIARTDNIGDLVLSLPVAGLLKQCFPKARIDFLARDYAQFVTKCSPFVDGFLSWDELCHYPQSKAIDTLKSFDVFISLFPQKVIAKLAAKAKVPYRIGTSHRPYHWLYCNKRVAFSRKKNSLHEAQLNLKLLQPLAIDTNLTLEALKPYARIHADLEPSIAKLLASDKFNLILHPGSNGNGREWPIMHFTQLIQSLDSKRYHILLTGLAGEQARCQPIIDAHPTVSNLIGQLSLPQFISLICHSNGLIAASTGPLHIAASAGIHTLGLFPPTRPIIGPNRWAPLGDKAQYLTSQHTCQQSCRNMQCPCMDKIDVERVANLIEQWLS